MQDAATGHKSETKFFEILPELAPRKAPISVDQQKPKLAPKSGVAELLVNAETLSLHGERDLARVLIYEALKRDSKNPIALKKAKQFLSTDRDLQKLIVMQKEICRSELSFENTAELGRLHYLQGDDDQALKHYSDCLNLVMAEDHALFEVYKNMGNILTRCGDYEGAEEYFHKAFTLNPESDVLSVNLGTLAVQRKNYAEALERFRSAVTQNPKNDKAWVGLALVHHEMADVQLAFANIEAAIDLNPGNRTAVHLYANWCVREFKYQNAIEALENYLANVEVDADLSLVLVHLFCKLNRMDLAKLEVERVLLWLPEHQQMLAIHTELS